MQHLEVETVSRDPTDAQKKGITKKAFSHLSRSLTGQEVEEKTGLTMSEAIMTMIINCVGASVLLFPKIAAEVGIVTAIVLCVVCTFVVHEAGVMICSACSIAEQIKHAPVTGYEELAEIIGGMQFKSILIVSKNLAMLGFIVCYMQFVVNAIAGFVEEEVEDQPLLTVRFLAVTPVFCMLGMLTNLKQLARFNNVGVVAVITEISCVVVGGILASMQLDSCQDESRLIKCRSYIYAPPQDGAVAISMAMGKYLAVFLFSFAIIATVPSIRVQLKDPSEMHNVLRVSFSAILVLYLLVMLIGYYGFGSHKYIGPKGRLNFMIDENVINSIAKLSPALKPVGIIASMGLVVNVLLSAPLIIFVVVSTFEAAGSGAIHTPLAMPNIAFRIGLILVLSILGSALPYLTEIIGLISSVACCGNNVLFPAVLHHKARGLVGVRAKRPKLRSLKYYAATVVGLTVLVFGFSGSYADLVKKFKETAAQKAAAANATAGDGSATLVALATGFVY